ncbi:hypothetical protein JCM5350_008270 [Sporobolomyces pararoseus]
MTTSPPHLPEYLQLYVLSSLSFLFFSPLAKEIRVTEIADTPAPFFLLSRSLTFSAKLLSSNYEAVLPILSTSTLQSILPFLPLPILLKLSSSSQTNNSESSVRVDELFGTSKEEEVSKKIRELIDFQRDWCCGSTAAGNGQGGSECPIEFKDKEYLIDMFNNHNNKTNIAAQSDDFKSLKILPNGIEYLLKVDNVDNNNKQKDKGVAMCRDVEEFEKNLNEMSNGIFKNLDWSNVILGGGSVLACLQNQQNSEEYSESDFDLFLYGLKPDQLISKVDSIISQINSTLPPPPPPEAEGEEERYDFEWSMQHRGELLILKGFNAITLLPPLSSSSSSSSTTTTDKGKRRRIIQIVLNSNETKFDSISNFDLDSCCFGYDGKKVFASPRGLRSLLTRVNLFDPNVARSIDPTASTIASRALKYRSRGFSLALSPTSTSYLNSSSSSRPSSSKRRGDLDLSKYLELLKRKVENDEQARKNSKTSDLFGLDLLLRKEWNRENNLEGEQGHSSEYGPVRNALSKLITRNELEKVENGEISHDYWEWQVKLSQQIKEFLKNDKNIVPSKKITESNLASYSIPYVAGFDREYLLALKEKVEDAFPQTWSKIQNLQYIVPVPKSFLPLVEKAEQEINSLVSSLSSSSSEEEEEEDEESPRKKPKLNDTSSKPPQFTQEEISEIHDNFEKLKRDGHELKPQEEEPISLYSSPPLKSFVPPFVGPYNPSSASKKTSSSSSSSFPIKFLHPLYNKQGQELGTTSKKCLYVYRTLSLPSLLQFRGLSNKGSTSCPSLDKLKTLLYLSYIALVRASTDWPQGIPMSLFLMSSSSSGGGGGMEEDEEVLTEEMIHEFLSDEGVSKRAKDGLKEFLKQPGKKDVEKKFKEELGWIEELGKKWIEQGKEEEEKVGGGGGGGGVRVGELDEDRKRWLDCWIEGKVMI